MSTPRPAAFELDTVTLPIEKILPTKQIMPADKSTNRYLTIVASIREIGIVEPLVVFRASDSTWMLLDGHLRREALTDLKQPTALCVVSTDDEAYTYNQKVNRIAPLQEHRMIMKAIAAGVSEERIARALNVNVATIKKTRSMVAGICSEAIEVLKDKPITAVALDVMKKVSPARQVEMAELMVAMRVYTGVYAKALFVSTPRSKLTGTEAAKREASADAVDLAKIEQETDALEREMRVLDDSYAKNMLNLTLVRAYVKSLLDDAKVVSYLATKHGELLAQLQKIVEATALEG